MLDGMSDSIQGSRIENLHSREVDRQSPTGLIFVVAGAVVCVAIACQFVDMRVGWYHWDQLPTKDCMWRL